MVSEVNALSVSDCFLSKGQDRVRQDLIIEVSKFFSSMRPNHSFCGVGLVSLKVGKRAHNIITPYSGKCALRRYVQWLDAKAPIIIFGLHFDTRVCTLNTDW